MCPDVKSFDLLTPDWLGFWDEDTSYLIFEVIPKSGYEEAAKDSFIMSSYNYPFFAPDSGKAGG